MTEDEKRIAEALFEVKKMLESPEPSNCTCQTISGFYKGEFFELPATTSREKCLVCKNWENE